MYCISLLAEEILAFEEGICSMELVVFYTMGSLC
jgi:hypothetical protein